MCATVGARPIGSQPSATSAHSSVLLGPARRRARSGCEPTGCRIERSGLALADRPGPAVRQGDLRAVVRDRRLAVEHLAHDRRRSRAAGRRVAPRLAVPALDDLRAGHADADDHAAAAGEGVDRHGVHRERRRWPRGELGDGGAELDAMGERGEVREGRERVGAVGLRAPHRVIAEDSRGAHQLDRDGEIGAPVEVQAEGELHRHNVASKGLRTFSRARPGEH